MSLSRIHLPATKACTQGINRFMRDFEVNEWRRWWEMPVTCIIAYSDGIQEAFTSSRALLASSLHAFNVEKQSRH